MKEQTRWTPKRLLSLLLALVMLLGVMPTAVFAFGDGETNTIDVSRVALAPTRNHVADGTIEGTNTKFSLLFSIDRKEVSKPGERVNVTAYADLVKGSGDDVEMTEVSLTDNKTTYGDKSWAHTRESSILGYPKVGDDGSADFTISVKYVVNGTTTGTKSVRVVITNLWTGYNITFSSKPAGARFTGGIPEDGKAKTHFKDAANGDFTPVYTIPATADAILDGYTFEGWTSERFTTASGNILSPNLNRGEYTYDFASDATFYAMLYANQEITFDPGDYGGVTGILNKTQYSQGTRYTITVQDPKLAGYKFDGWLVDGSTIVHNYKKGETVYGITSATKLIAQWTPDDGSAPVGSHKVTFYENAAGVYNMPASQTVKSNEKATTPTVTPQRDGYTFGGWYKDAACTTAFNFTTDTVTDDLELYAKWTATPVTVTFPAAADLPAGVTIFPVGGSISSSVGSVVHFNVTVPDKYNTTDLLVHAGHFGSTYRVLAPVARYETADSVTLYYQFTVTEDLVDPATSELDVTVSNFIEKTFTVMMPTGHFDAEITGVAPTGSTVATDKKSASIVYGGSYTFTVTPKQGYDVEVYVNGVKKDAGTGNSYTVTDVTGPQRVEVVESAIPNYNVTFTVPLSGQSFTQSVTRGGNASKPGVDPEREGYTFAGWYTETEYKKDTGATQFDFDTKTITMDTVLYGKLTPKTYQISYNANTTDAVTNMPTADQSKTHGLAVPLSTKVPTRDGWNFLGWGTTASATAASYQPGDMYSVDQNITLYAVWQQKTYTITFSSGEGYSLHNGHASMTVAHGANFDFNLIVDRDYAQNEPKVWKNTDGVNSGKPLSNGTPTINQDGSKKYHYTLTNVTENIAINVDVRSNTIYTVTFMTNGSIYQTQQVGYNEKATRPVDPVVEGYKFEGWYKEADYTTPWYFVDTLKEGSTTEYYPADTVKANTTIYAKLDPITPQITWTIPTAADGYTIEVTGTKPDATTASTLTSGDQVAYGSEVTFTITIHEGFDATAMQVGVNGVMLAPTQINDNVYSYQFKAKEDSTIYVTGVTRKTVTITYDANARDDVSGMPNTQTVKYYLESATDNDKIINQTPVRTGYTFLGWSTNSEATDADTGYDATTIMSAAGADAKFTENTTLYAVWQATETTVTLAITDVAYTASETRVIQYEGESITLQAKLNVAAKGTIEFYKAAAAGETGKMIGSTTINGKTAELRVQVGEYKTNAKDEYYYAIFKSEADEGYADSTKSNEMNVGIFSKAICWVLADNTASELNVYASNSATGTPIPDAMVAGNTYTLEVKTGKIIGLETLDTKVPVLGKDYKIVWQYFEVDRNDWKTVSESSEKATYLVTGEYSGYQFRAQIVPLGKDHDSLYLKAAKYGDAGLLKDQYDVCLYTKPTKATVLQDTTTTLAVTNAETEEGNVYINGTQPFGTVGSHLAQFEGEKVTLTATVKDAADAAVTKGYVNFYRNDETTPMNAAPIAIGQNGTASYEATTSKFSAGEAINAKDTYYAVYLVNDTYNTSSSETALQTVYIKSTELTQPVLNSALAGKRGGATANTTAGADLTELLAGVQHTFSLVETGAQTKVEGVDGQFSVVAKDGRTVDADNYTVEWLKTTGSNEQKLDVAENAKEIKVDDNKFGDKYRIKLVAKNHMTAGALSNYAVIGTKQNVKVTVSASEDWVYQRNEITLTAEVAAAGENPTMQPAAGDAVSFYYEDNGAWVKLGSATLTKDSNQSGKMLASITTKELPVTAATNVKRNVVITAVYEGNDTFNESAKVTKRTDTTYKIEQTDGCVTTNKTVTVYSSVVYVTDTVENKTVTVADKTHRSGIYIFAEDDTVLANEVNVNLKLSEVYTLDHAEDKSKLAYGTDYTVQWQKLTNASAYPDKAADTTPWTNITSATGTTCQIKAEQGAAYRAVITVNDTPIAKGSYTEFQQEIPGRKVYYSNILVAANAPATLTVNVNTSNTGKGYEGIVEGETVTIHTFTSGATGTTPISKLTVNIYAGKNPATDAEPVFTAEKADVNGHVSFDWSNGVTPGYYTLKVNATFTNGYDDKEITRTLIVRDNDYQFELTGDNAVYNGKTQGLNVEVQSMDIESAFAQKSVVVYYYTDEARTQQVEPTQAGTYYATVRLQESAYWTEKSIPATFTIQPRAVEVVDLVAQAKVYDGTTDADIQEIILNDATVDSATGLPNGSNGIIDGDSVYAAGTGYTSQATAGSAMLGVKDVTLKGDDAANYTLTGYNHTEELNIQRSQVKGAIINSSYLYTGKSITIEKNDQNVYLIDQAGTRLTPAEYEITYYYHNGDAVEQVPAMNKLGKYTVIARPEQNNYKGGAEQTVYVVSDNATVGTLDTSARSALLHISNTVKVYDGQATGVTATATKGTASASYYYNADWQNEAPTNAGRYLVKATVTNDGVTDTAYGIFTVVKARPQFNPATDKASVEYTSGRYDGTVSAGFVDGKSDSAAETYVTYTGGTIQGVAYEAPTEVGKYIATVHVGETANYTAHEERVAFEITPKALTIRADSISRQQYGAYPDLTASFDGLATGGIAADTSLRDVQIQPELIDDSNYTNDASDQVGKNYSITAVAALARNYDISYVKGNMAVTREDPKPYLEIRGMIENGNGATDLAYYGDVIQLYAYGNQSKTTTGDVHNTSSVLAWSVDGPATITQDGLLTVTGVGDVTVTLKRGIGAQQISTTLKFKAKKQEVKVVVPDQDLIYNGVEQKYNGNKFYAENAKGEKITATPYEHDGKVKRTNVGSQIITSWVGDANATYQSEKYCGLFTINVKDVQVWPTAANTTYGAPVTGLTYTEVTPAGSDMVLTDGKAVSVADVYGNLDVLDGYEILVAGRENENYNVEYVTDQSAHDVKVEEKALTVATGTLNAQTGMTSGSLNPAGKFPVNGKDVEPSATMGGANVRMYGEPNWVMDFTLTSLIQGDTLADLVEMAEKLVDFPHDIAADANITYPTRDNPTPTAVDGRAKYDVETDATKIAFGNYNESYSIGTQNVYQRPVTLKLREGLTKLTVYTPEVLDSSGAVTSDGRTKLLELLLNNLVVDKYNGEGGLAELLKHTIEDLDIQIDTISVAPDKLTLKLKLGNLNYWLDPNSASIDIDLVSTKIVPVYSTLDWTNFTVTMYDETKTHPVNVHGNVRFFIYQKKAGVELKYSNYKNDTIIRSGLMTPTGRPGQYLATFSRLPAGEYAIFAIAENYTIVE